MFNDLITVQILKETNIKFNKKWKKVRRKYHSPKGRRMAMKTIMNTPDSKLNYNFQLVSIKEHKEIHSSRKEI